MFSSEALEVELLQILEQHPSWIRRWCEAMKRKRETWERQVQLQVRCTTGRYCSHLIEWWLWKMETMMWKLASDFLIYDTVISCALTLLTLNIIQCLHPDLLEVVPVAGPAGCALLCFGWSRSNAGHGLYAASTRTLGRCSLIGFRWNLYTLEN